jgi:hypothetical protein
MGEAQRKAVIDQLTPHAKVKMESWDSKLGDSRSGSA